MLRMHRLIPDPHPSSLVSNSATHWAAMASSWPIGADALARLGLQADALGLDAEDVGQPLADGLAMGEELGTLGEDDAVDVDDLPAQRGHGVQRGGEHFGRVAAAVLGVGVGEHLAHVAQGGRAQQGVDHGVQQRVGVAMADRLPIVGNVDAAQSQRPARPQPVGVVSDSNPHSVRGLVSLCWQLVVTWGIIQKWAEGEASENAE